jgi:hypothetical protein
VGFALLGCYAAYVGSCLPSFRESLTNTMRNIPEDQRPLPHGAGSLQSPKTSLRIFIAKLDARTNAWEQSVWTSMMDWKIGVRLTSWGRYILSSSVLRPAMGSSPGAHSLGLKRPWFEADHSSPSSVKVKNEWSFISTRSRSTWQSILISTWTIIPLCVCVCEGGGRCQKVKLKC